VTTQHNEPVSVELPPLPKPFINLDMTPGAKLSWGAQMRQYALDAIALLSAKPEPAGERGEAHPIETSVAHDLERSDWTPEDALRFYAAGRHYDTVPNGDGTSSTRILDTGAIASNALKELSRSYAESKGDVALLAADAQRQALKPLTEEQREKIAQGWRKRNWTLGDIIDAVEAAHGIKEQA
jgi:hypothetical protein